MSGQTRVSERGASERDASVRQARLRARLRASERGASWASEGRANERGASEQGAKGFGGCKHFSAGRGEQRPSVKLGVQGAALSGSSRSRDS